jgi:hypothetical protein
MYLRQIIMLLALFFADLEYCKAYHALQHISNTSVNESFGQNPEGKLIKKKGLFNKNKSKEDKKAFPIFATIGTISGVLGLFLLGLGIYLGFPLFIGLLTGLLAAAAFTLGILGLKKEESKTFCFISIMLGAVGILGAIFFIISASS